jgi:hypothetical protein
VGIQAVQGGFFGRADRVFLGDFHWNDQEQNFKK